ncbi:MAG: hypothetical protein PHU71_04515 [Candidatus Gracilibacteria bacterium]|nr:hypothetical protein [Candidatus Gracilibacteria bacterium]
MKKTLILLLALLMLAACGKAGTTTTSSDEETPKASQEMTTREEAISEAYKIYDIYKNEGTDLSSGPCLSNRLIPNWALDIAHKPRTAEDDLPENQCEDYTNGTVEHFVELTPEGKLIRAE